MLGIALFVTLVYNSNTKEVRSMTQEGRLGERIKKARLEKQLTLAQVADQIGIAEASLQRYESGTIKNPKQENLKKLADILGVDLNFLMGYQNQNNQHYVDDDLKDLEAIYKRLSRKYRHELMAKAYELEKEMRKEEQ